MCKLTNYIDSAFRYLVILLLCMIIYLLSCMVTGFSSIPDSNMIKSIVSAEFAEQMDIQVEAGRVWCVDCK